MEREGLPYHCKDLRANHDPVADPFGSLKVLSPDQIFGIPEKFLGFCFDFGILPTSTQKWSIKHRWDFAAILLAVIDRKRYHTSNHVA